MKKNIALVAGGYSGEFEVSVASAKQIKEDIDKEKYNVYLIILTRQSWYCEQNGVRTEVNKNDFSLRFGAEKVLFDAAYITIHGTPGEDGLLQGYFDMLQIPYTTCSTIVSAITFDKSVCNTVVRSLGIVDVANNVITRKTAPLSSEEIMQRVKLPVFVKPTAGGSSIGMSKVCKQEDLLPAVEKAFGVWHDVMIEEFIEGREFSCGVMQIENEVKALPVTEIVPMNEFFDYEAKYKGKSKELTPAPISPELTERIQHLTEEIYKGLHCSGVCRADFRYDEKQNKIFFLEINTTPGQSAQSIVPQQVRAMGKDTKWLYNTILEQLNL